jgi:hypothetical protein
MTEEACMTALELIAITSVVFLIVYVAHRVHA